MKYFLRIEGTKEEIDTARGVTDYTVVWDTNLWAMEAGWCSAGLNFRRWSCAEVEFKVVEPRYRVKTLVELVQEYGEEVTIDEEAAILKVRGKDWIDLRHLGDASEAWSSIRASSPLWARIFLKEVE